MDTSSTPSSSRILYDVLCAVCHDYSSGKHYGVYACDGCAGFFKRSVRRERNYECKALPPASKAGCCVIDKAHRNQCRACRMVKCIRAGMNRDAVQHERGPRNSTIRRQMALYMKATDNHTQNQPAPEMALPKPTFLPPHPFLNFFYPFAFPALDLPSPLVFLPKTVPAPSVIPNPVLGKYPREACEAAAKLLFMNVRWVKGIPEFERLSIETRFYLLAETWKDLFVIGAAQYMYQLDLKLLREENDAVNLEDVDLFQAAMAEILKLRPFSMEFTCLRGIVLFNASQIQRQDGIREKLQELLKVTAEFERCKYMLNEYVALTQPLERYRVMQLLDLLPFIRRVPSSVIVDLFFRATIGNNISIERIICDSYKSM